MVPPPPQPSGQPQDVHSSFPPTEASAAQAAMEVGTEAPEVTARGDSMAGPRAARADGKVVAAEVRKEKMGKVQLPTMQTDRMTMVRMHMIPTPNGSITRTQP